MIINFISGPRNISTAMMYSFAQRSDTKVIDEPFYGHYLKTTGIDHPGREETLASMPLTFEGVMKNIAAKAEEKEHLFLKNMAHHHVNIEWNYLLPMNNVFLIRDPKQLIASFAQVIPNPTMQDIGLKLEAELVGFITEKTGKTPVVIDTNSILPDPEKGIQSLCERIGIPFEKSMLSWKQGALPEDGAWATYWYKNVHNSTGFMKQPTSSRELPDHCTALYEEALPYYEKLIEYVV